MYLFRFVSLFALSIYMFILIKLSNTKITPTKTTKISRNYSCSFIICYHFQFSNFRKYGFRLGLQSVTGVLSSLFFLGLFYRSASLYHPQRRAILHLKDMSKRKGKDKDKIKNKPPYFDLTTLKAKPFHIILLSTAFATFGIYTPLFFFVSKFIFIFNGS